MNIAYEPSMLTLIFDEITPREKIIRLQREIDLMPPYDPVVTHEFEPHVYRRKIFLDKDSLVVGKIHRHAHWNMISSGHVTVYTEFGETEMRGPFGFESKPGTKRVVLAHEDTIWTTYHVTNETDLARIEEYVIAKSYDDLQLEGPDMQKLVEVTL